MLVKELMNHLEKMDQEAAVKLKVTTKIDDEDDIPTIAMINTIEFGDSLVVLKGYDELIEWD